MKDELVPKAVDDIPEHRKKAAPVCKWLAGAAACLAIILGIAVINNCTELLATKMLSSANVTTLTGSLKLFVCSKWLEQKQNSICLLELGYFAVCLCRGMIKTAAAEAIVFSFAAACGILSASTIERCL